MDDPTVKSLADSGVVKIRNVFSADDAERMREVVWRDLYLTDGVEQADPSTWHRKTPLRKLARAKRDPIFHAMLGEPLRELADAVLGEGWRVSPGFGNLLVSFPDAEHWWLPGIDGGWHSDLGGRPDPADPPTGLRVFALFGHMPPGSGGTLLVGGSERMIKQYVAASPSVERRTTGFVHRTDGKPEADAAWEQALPWLAELTLAERPEVRDPSHDDDRRRRFMETVTDVDGVPAQVIEACGEPGDVYVCTPWTIHCKPPNASGAPRFLRAPWLYAKRSSEAD